MRAPAPLRRTAGVLALAASTLAAACAADVAAGDARVSSPAEGAPSAAPAAATVGGGYASLDAALAEFRADLPPVATLASASDGREALVERFVAAVAAADTADIRAMTMSAAEFGWLYYPTSPYTRPPTRQGAPLVWFLHMEGSRKGITRVLRRFGDQPLRLVDHACDAEPVVEGDNRLWTGCRLRVALPTGETVEHRFFGSILERGGRFKIFSYANDF